MSKDSKPATDWMTIDELRQQQKGCEFRRWLDETLPRLTPEQQAKFNRYGDLIAECGDWTDDGEWIPPEEAMRTLQGDKKGE